MRKVATMPLLRFRKVNKGVFTDAHGVQFASFDCAPKALARDAQDLRRFAQSDQLIASDF
jgi:hypothetical protein